MQGFAKGFEDLLNNHNKKEDQITTPIDPEIKRTPRNSCLDALAFDLTNNLQTESLNSNEYAIVKEENVDVREEIRLVDNDINSVIDENALCQKIMTDSDDIHIHQEEQNNNPLKNKLIKGFAKGFEDVMNKQNKSPKEE
jgi:hypothetical protein